jgi:hypothetical protein
VHRAAGAAAYQRNGVHREPKPEAPAGDRVDLSDHARRIAQLRELPEVRSELVEKARLAVDDPEYLSEDRLGVAIDRMLEDIEAEDLN